MQGEHSDHQRTKLGMGSLRQVNCKGSFGEGRLRKDALGKFLFSFGQSGKGLDSEDCIAVSPLLRISPLYFHCRVLQRIKVRGNPEILSCPQNKR